MDRHSMHWAYIGNFTLKGYVTKLFLLFFVMVTSLDPVQGH